MNDKKIKDMTLEFVKNYLRIEEDFIEDDAEITLYMSASAAYLMKKWKMNNEAFNNSTILVIPFLMLISEFYSTKSVNIQANSKVNPILDRFIAIEAPLF